MVILCRVEEGMLPGVVNLITEYPSPLIMLYYYIHSTQSMSIESGTQVRSHECHNYLQRDSNIFKARRTNCGSHGSQDHRRCSLRRRDQDVGSCRRHYEREFLRHKSRCPGGAGCLASAARGPF